MDISEFSLRFFITSHVGITILNNIIAHCIVYSQVCKYGLAVCVEADSWQLLQWKKELQIKMFNFIYNICNDQKGQTKIPKYAVMQSF